MKTMARMFVLILCLALCVPAAVAQQDDKYRFEFFGGATLPIDKDFEVGSPQTVIPIKGMHEFSFGGRGGVRIGIDGAGHWGQDYSYSFGANASKIVTSRGQFGFTNRIHQVATNILWYPWGLEGRKVFPYATAGVGATFVTLTRQTINEALDPNRSGLGQLQNEVLFAFNAGGGVRARLNDRYGVRIDVRDYMSRAYRYGLPQSSSDPNTVVLPVSSVFHQLTVTFGVVIHF